MLKRLLNWFRNEPAPQRRPTIENRRRASAHAAVHRASAKTVQNDFELDFPATEEPFDGRIENLGPGKNVLIRNRFVREDTGTHESLSILDESILDSGEEEGIDPYNSGRFDRSKNWDKRFRN